MRAAAALLIAGLVWLAGAPAKAETLYAETKVNGVAAGLTTLEKDGGDLFAAPAELQALGLAAPADGGKLPLKALKGVSYTFDAPSQTLLITATPEALQGDKLSAGRRDGVVTPDRAPWGLLVNYSYYALATSGGGSQAAAYGEARVFGPFGVATSSFAARTDSGPYGGKVQRLDTAVMFDDIGGLRRTVIGDYISTSLPWTRSVRAAGFSIATDFSLQPNLVTAPMPRITGSSAVPTTVDLYVDNVKRFSAGAKAGPFAVTDLPVMDGRGQVSVVVTDTLGRQSVQSFAFYAASELLRPGLTTYAVEGGFLRENYATKDDRYTDGFVSAVARRGVTDHVTLEATATASREVQTAGVGVTAKAGEEALFAAAFSASARGGVQAYASARRDTRRYSLFAAVQYSAGGYRDLASSADASSTRRMVQVGASMPTRWGAVSASYNRVSTEWDGPGDKRMRRSDVELVGVNWSQSFGRLNFYANAFASGRGSRAKVFTLGFNLPFGRAGSAGGSVTTSGDRVQGNLSAAQAAPLDGGIAWRTNANFAGSRLGGSRLEGEVERTSGWGQVGAGASVADNGRNLAGRVYGSGSVIFMNSASPRFAARVGDGFAMVETGAPGVEITVENNLVGTTDAKGRLFLPQLPALAVSRVALRAETVDLDHEILLQTAEVRPARRAGAIVRLPIRMTNSLQVKLAAPDGQPIPPGAAVLIDGVSRARVGHDGLAYFSDFTGPAVAEVQTTTESCFVELPDVPAATSRKPIGPLVCRPSNPGRPVPDLRRRDERPSIARLLRRSVATDVPRLQPKLNFGQRLHRLYRSAVHLYFPGLRPAPVQDRAPSRIVRDNHRSQDEAG